MSRALSSLLFRSARLQSRIDDELRRPRPDLLTLLRLKALRLRLGRRFRAMPLATLAV